MSSGESRKLKSGPKAAPSVESAEMEDMGRGEGDRPEAATSAAQRGDLPWVTKRDGRVVRFERDKIAEAIFKAAQAVGGDDRTLAEDLADVITLYLRKNYSADRPPKVEEIQDAVEKVLIETKHAKTAKAYILYREKRARIRKLKSGQTEELVDEIEAARPRFGETTDLSLFVRRSDENIAQWDRQKISDALVRETWLDRGIADAISLEVERQIFVSKTEVITAPLVREMVNAKLIEYGLEDVRRKHTRLGVPLYDAEQIISVPNKENANIPHNPEATNLMLAERIKKEYALLNVFSQEVADAHIKGDIHLHDLGFIDRPYCSGQSLEYVKKFGLDLPNALSIAKPAKHPETLLAHMVKFSAALQGHFAGAIGWDAINIFFAPFLEGLDDRQIHQLAQMLIFEYSQQAVARGGQAIFSDINLYWETPKHFEGVLAIGPGGEYTDRLYSDYQETAQRFAWALFDVFKEGDGCGRPFFFPKPLVHITEKFFLTPNHESFLNHICSVASDKGNTYFVFDRGDTAKVSECCRLSFRLEEADLAEAITPWKMRYAAMQNVTVNLPRIAYLAQGSDEKLFNLLDERMELVVKAHQEKKAYIEGLLALGERGPLSLLAMKRDGESYLRMRRVTYLVGILGLNEIVQAHTGHQLHESEEAFSLGLRVVAHLNLACRKLSQREKMRFVLEQTPAESTCYRLAKLDTEHFPKQSAEVVKGNEATNQIYYTNSSQLSVSEVMNPIDRVKKEGLFHDMIEAGALTHVWLADSQPSAESLANFVKKTFYQTRNAQIAFSPEFTSCNECSKVSRGLTDRCAYCESPRVDGITRVTGYFSRVSGWNPGKRGELNDRARWGQNNILLPETGHDDSDGVIQIFGVGRSALHPDGCARCDQAKDIIGNKLGEPFKFWDVDTSDGLAEFSRLNLGEFTKIPIIRIGEQDFDVLGKAVKHLKAMRRERSEATYQTRSDGSASLAAGA